MKLKKKLFLVVLVSLLIQVLIGGAFTIRTFLEQSRRSSQQQLVANWKRAYDYLEKIKHFSFTHLVNLSRFIGATWSETHNERSVIETITHFSTDIDADRIIALDREYLITADISSGNSEAPPSVRQITSSFPFDFPVNRYMYLPGIEGNRELHLVTGTHMPSNAGSFYSIFLVKHIDHDLATSIAQELGFSLALFVGNELVCSDIPRFALPDLSSSNDIRAIKTSTGDYNLLSRIYSTDVPGKLRLVVLESTIPSYIYAEKLVRSFVLAFVITLLISAVFAVAMTTYFTASFTKLQVWMEHYMNHGVLEKFEVHTRDEIGFLTSTFHTLADKLIQEEKLIKRQLEEISFLHNYNENILKNLQAGVLVIDSEGSIEYCNDYICRLIRSDIDVIRSMSISDFLNSYFKVPGEKSIRLPGTRRIESLIFQKGDTDTLRFAAKIIPLSQPNQESKDLMVLEDITGTERFLSKMIQAEKIVSLGLLSAGVAHEINNPLGSILSHVQYLSEVEKDGDKQDSLRWIENETGRIADIVERLLNFARSGDNDGGTCKPGDIVSEILALLNLELAKKEIQVTREVDESAPAVLLSAGGLKQVLTNILINAIQAADKGGRIKITVGRSEGRVRLAIEDNGKGVSREDMSHIFDPFFTTKQAENGTGLGLSICYSVISKAGGDIQVRSAPKKGTTVEILIPAEADR